MNQQSMASSRLAGAGQRNMVNQRLVARLLVRIFLGSMPGQLPARAVLYIYKMQVGTVAVSRARGGCSNSAWPVSYHGGAR